MKRNLTLDVLRGAAILLVLFHHEVIHPAEAGSLAPLFACLKRIGWAGVDLFFVISGFLIGGLLFKELDETGRVSVRRFLLRRAFKIWPLYSAFLAFGFLKLWRDVGNPGAAARAMLPNLVHLQNYLGTPFGPTWSLAVEEHFYLLLPALLVMLWAGQGGPRRPLPWVVPAVAGALLVCCLGLRLATAATGPYDFGRQMTPTHLRIDALFLGVLLAYLHRFHPRLLAPVARSRWTLAAAGVLVAPMFVVENSAPFVHTAGLTMLAVGFACLLIAAVHSDGQPGPFGRALRSTIARGVAWVGTYSYAIYLFHTDWACRPVQHWLRPVFDPLPPTVRYLAFTVSYLIAAVGAGVLMTHLVERPALALRDRWVPTTASAVRRPRVDSAGPELMPAGT